MDGNEEPSDAGDYFLFVVLNDDWLKRTVLLPRGKRWRRAIDTGRFGGDAIAGDGVGPLVDPADRCALGARTTVVLVGT